MARTIRSALASSEARFGSTLGAMARISALALLSAAAFGCANEGSKFDNPASGGAGGGGNDSGGGDSAACQEDPPVTDCTPATGNTTCHEFYANDNDRTQVSYVNEFDPSKNWTWKIEGCLSGVDGHCPRQVTIVDSVKAPCGKALMISDPKGYQEHDLKTGDLLYEYDKAFPPGVTGAVRLPNTNTALLIVGSTADVLVVVNPDGAEVSRCNLPGSTDLSHTRVLVREEETGWFWFGRMLDLYAVDDQCQEQWHAQLGSGDKAYKVFPCGDSVYATTGATQKVDTFSRSSKTITGSVGANEPYLDFFSGFYRFGGTCNGPHGGTAPEGNIIAANWLGHVQTPAQDTPHLIEFTPDNQVVWTWGNQTLARQITNLWVVR